MSFYKVKYNSKLWVMDKFGREEDKKEPFPLVSALLYAMSVARAQSDLSTKKNVEKKVNKVPQDAQNRKCAVDDNAERAFCAALDKLSSEAPPIEEWKIRFVAEKSFPLLRKNSAKVCKILEEFIIKSRSHYARCGIYIIDSICYNISGKNQNVANTNTSAPLNRKKWSALTTNIFLSTIERRLPCMFYSFIKRAKSRIIQLEPIIEEDVKLHERDQLWITKIIRRWHEYQYFNDSTISYICTKLKLPMPSRKHLGKRAIIPSTGSTPKAKRVKLGEFPNKRRRKNVRELPEEVLLVLISYLKPRDLWTLSHTCQLFYRIAREPSLWSIIKLTYYTKTTPLLQRLNSISFAWSCVESIDLSFSPEVSDSLLQVLVQHFHRLEHINVQGCRGISDAALLRCLIQNNSCHLKSLNLSFTNIGDESCALMISSCKQLKRLSVAECSYFTLEMFLLLLQSCQELEYIDISCCHWLISPFTSMNMHDKLSSSLQEIRFFLYPEKPTTFPVCIELYFKYLKGMFPELRSFHSDLETIGALSISNVEVNTFDAWALARDNNKTELYSHLHRNPSQYTVHGNGGKSLFEVALSTGAIQVLELLQTQSIITEVIDSKKSNYFKLIQIHKSLSYFCSFDIKRDHYSFAYQFLVFLVSSDAHVVICSYCGEIINFYSADIEFLKRFLETATHKFRESFARFGGWLLQRIARRFISQDTISNTVSLAVKADIPLLSHAHQGKII